MPIDGPMWRLHVQRYNKDDGSDGTLIIFKSHHSFCDGVSVMCMAMALSHEYDRSYFIKGKDASLFQRIFTRMSFPFIFPMVLFKTLMMMAPKDNIITKNRESKLTGEMNCSCTGVLKMNEMKDLSKKLGVTINDIVTCSISTSINTIFKGRGDNNESIQIVIPGNVRF